MRVDLSSANAELGSVLVTTTSGRGMTPREIAEAAYRKVVHVSDTCHPAIKDQMRDVERAMVSAIERAIIQGVKSDRTTVYNMLMEAGHPALAEAVRREKV